VDDGAAPKFTDIRARTAHDLLTIISKFSDDIKRYTPGICIWRGVGNAAHTLMPLALREQAIETLEGVARIDADGVDFLSRDIPQQLQPQFQRMYREWCALQLFVRAANTQALPLPLADDIVALMQVPSDEAFVTFMLGKSLFDEIHNWPPKELWSALALAQHYGMPTRMLDWTVDPLIAAYFAARSAVKRICKATSLSHVNDEHMVVWFANGLALRRTSLFTSYPSNVALVTPHAADPRCVIHIITPPYAGNPNLAAQKGTFTLATGPALVTAPTERLAHDDVFQHIIARIGDVETRRLVLNVPASSRVIFTRFLLSLREAPGLLKILARRGYDANRLFPGYGGSVLAIEEEIATLKATEVLREYLDTNEQEPKSNTAV
jgi:hypothetical protein